jgi:hypothetical protein
VHNINTQFIKTVYFESKSDSSSAVFSLFGITFVLFLLKLSAGKGCCRKNLGHSKLDFSFLSGPYLVISIIHYGVRKNLTRPTIPDKRFKYPFGHVFKIMFSIFCMQKWKPGIRILINLILLLRLKIKTCNRRA